jgi:hypothetical protein
MFHFPTFPPHTLCVQMRVTGHDSSWVSPFGHPRITARLPTPRGLSQAPTSFIGSWCQGIHHVHLVACQLLQRCSRPLCSSQTTNGTPPPHPPTHAEEDDDPQKNRPDSPTTARSIPQDPTVCLSQPTHQHPTFHTNPTGPVVLTSTDEPADQLVDVPLVSIPHRRTHACAMRETWTNPTTGAGRPANAP